MSSFAIFTGVKELCAKLFALQKCIKLIIGFLSEFSILLTQESQTDPQNSANALQNGWLQESKVRIT